ncbi:hypothetical protein B0H14DRAFT_3637671, partial [Mycena olivaceomarginata]
RLDHTISLQCASECVSLRLPSLPPLLLPLRSLLLPFLTLLAVPSSLPSPSPPSFAPASPSLLVWACPAVPYQPTAHLRSRADRRAARTSPLVRADARSRRGLVLQTHTEISFAADKCDAKPALHIPAPCVRSPLFFPPLSRLPHLFFTSHSPPALLPPAPYASPLPPLLPFHLSPYAAGHTPPHHHSLPSLPSSRSAR